MGWSFDLGANNQRPEKAKRRWGPRAARGYAPHANAPSPRARRGMPSAPSSSHHYTHAHHTHTHIAHTHHTHTHTHTHKYTRRSATKEPYGACRERVTLVFAEAAVGAVPAVPCWASIVAPSPSPTVVAAVPVMALLAPLLTPSLAPPLASSASLPTPTTAAAAVAVAFASAASRVAKLASTRVRATCYHIS